MSGGEWQIVLTKKAHKQIPDLKAAGLDEHVRRLFAVLRRDPRGEPPPYEELRGDLRGCFSRRLNIHHRLVYEILPEQRTVRVLSMWTHYGTLHEVQASGSESHRT